jgi:hypothetical protein
VGPISPTLLASGAETQRKDPNGKVVSKLVGASTLLLLLFANPLVLRPRFWSASVVTRSLIMDAALLVVGVGLFFLRKWAALLGSAMAGYFVFLLVKTGQSQNLAWSLLFLLPLCLTVTLWSSLEWGSKRRDLLLVFSAVTASALVHYVAFLLRP